MRYPRYEPDWGQELVTRVETYLEGLWAGLDTEDGPETLTGFTFCGCETCVERERTFIIVMLTLEGFEAGRVRLAPAS